MNVRQHFTAVVLALSLGSELHTEDLSYADLTRRIYDLERLADPPRPGERSGSASSRDRRGRYDRRTKSYRDWGANQDTVGFVRREGTGIVAADLDGPGVIWRVWAAQPSAGAIRIYVDGNEKPVLERPFRDYFDAQSPPFDLPELVRALGGASHNAVPIPFQESCRVVLDEGWGSYYQLHYTTFPPEVRVPSFRGTFNASERAALLRAQQVLSATGSDPKPARADEELLTKTISVPAGGLVTLGDLQGPRAISQVHIALPSEKNQLRTLRELTLSITWDDDTRPSVWAPLGDFFAVSGGVTHRALPTGRTANGLYAYWFMPFQSRARIVAANEGDTAREIRVKILHHSLREADRPRLRFHAKWHRDDYTGLDEKRYALGDRWPDWPLLVSSSRGRFCGVHLHVWDPNPLGSVSDQLHVDPDDLPFRIYDGMRQAALRWRWGEGDEKFFVDGETAPSTHGTGTQHYFGGLPGEAGYESPFHMHRTAQGALEGHVANARFHIADNVPYQSRFEATIEKYHPNRWPLLYAATAYWYQAADDPDDYDRVDIGDRVDYYVLPESTSATPQKGRYEAEVDLQLDPLAGTQDMRVFGPDWSGDGQMLWNGKIGDTTMVRFDTAVAGRYEIHVRLTKAPDYGIFQISLNGRDMSVPIDLYATRVELAPVANLGEAELRRGIQKMAFKLVAANGAAKAYGGDKYLLGVDYVELRRLP